LQDRQSDVKLGLEIVRRGPGMPRGSKNGTTIVDIANKLGLSAMTVSRALTGSSEVSERTRKRVLRCAELMGYQPNRWARSLVTRRSSIIGVVIPDISHSFFAEVTFGIEEIVERSGFDILLCHSHNEATRERAEIDTLVGSRVDGLIVATVQPQHSGTVFTQLSRRQIPFVLVDRFFPGLDFSAARADDRQVGRVATEFAVLLGHRRIGHIEGPDLSPASLRKQGYLEVLREHDIPISNVLIAPGNFEIESGRRAMQRLLSAPLPPTAVFAANDPMAIGAVYACRDAGLQVPSDVSIIGAGNIEGMHHPNPFLTTIDWPRVDLGRAAARMLLEAIADPKRQEPALAVFAPTLLVRQSTAAWEAGNRGSTSVTNTRRGLPASSA
jgi:LacI family transcriptional regulator